MDARSQKIDEIMYETNEKISAIVKLEILDFQKWIKVINKLYL